MKNRISRHFNLNTNMNMRRPPITSEGLTLTSDGPVLRFPWITGTLFNIARWGILSATRASCSYGPNPYEK